jgi:hypothetical protein
MPNCKGRDRLDLCGRLEQSILPLTTGVFLERVRKHARRTGMSLDSAMQSLHSKASDDELERLTTEFEWMAFGDDIAARDAAKREVFAAAGYPDWTSPPIEGSRDEGW